MFATTTTTTTTTRAASISPHGYPQKSERERDRKRDRDQSHDRRARTLHPLPAQKTVSPPLMGVSTYEWMTRCVPALSICAVGALLVFSFVFDPFGKGEKGRHYGQATLPQLILSVYTLFLHVMSIAFPVRVCWAMGDVIARIKEAATTVPNTRRRRVQSIKNDDGTTEIPVPLFAILLPAYKEETDTLEETLRVLASHSQARLRYHVYLAMEEKEEKAAEKAASLIAKFDKCFFRMSYTIHPANIPGEAQGKSSNEAWAAKQAIKDYPDRQIRQNIIFTTMDADTHLSSRYFDHVARLHTECLETNQTTFYVPPLVFDRNLHRVPLFVRTADLMWAGAGLSSLYDGSTVCIPTSVYSLPMSLVEYVGGWDTGPGAIGEDMHMYLKCFFALAGNLKVQVVYAAASQCNVSSDAQGVHGYFVGLHARYKQALRHMWGSVDTGFAIRESVKMFQGHRGLGGPGHADLPLSAPKCVMTPRQRMEEKDDKLTQHSSNWTAFYTSTGLHQSLDSKSANRDQPALKPINFINLLVLYHRLFEAHFLPTHLAVILTCSGIYTALFPRFLIPVALRVALDISGWFRLIGFCTMLYFFYRYEQYHRLCVALREEEMRRAGLLEDMEEHDGFTLDVFQIAGLAETALFPLGGFLFGAIPALQAVLSHLFTDRLTYVVSLKPQFALRPWKDISRMTP